MSDLTEQWKKGELPECEYYVQDKEGNTSTMHLWNDERCKLSVRCKRLSILEPVPSYGEWQASEKYNKHLEEKIKIYERKEKQATETSIAYNELAEENKELKEILERHKKATAKAQIRSCDLEIINTQLKDLLEECKPFVELCNYTPENKKLLDSIDKML